MHLTVTTYNKYHFLWTQPPVRQFVGRNEIIVDEKLAERRYIVLLIRGIVSTQKSARGIRPGKKKL